MIKEKKNLERNFKRKKKKKEKKERKKKEPSNKFSKLVDSD